MCVFVEDVADRVMPNEVCNRRDAETQQVAYHRKSNQLLDRKRKTLYKAHKRNEGLQNLCYKMHYLWRY